MSGLSPWPEGKYGRRPNLSPEFVAEVEKKTGLKFVPDGKGDVARDPSTALGTTFGPEDLFNYIYAVFHSPTYRSRYAEFLKIDFPRVPVTSDPVLFSTLSRLGGELVVLHLMESPGLTGGSVQYPEPGPNEVEHGFLKYVPAGEKAPVTGETVEAGRIYISRGDPKAGKSGQYFGGVPQGVWEFQVGGYQVCDKWLKDRAKAGRTLSFDDQQHYKKVVEALGHTIRLMKEIEAAIPSWPIQ